MGHHWQVQHNLVGGVYHPYMRQQQMEEAAAKSYSNLDSPPTIANRHHLAVRGLFEPKQLNFSLSY